MDRQSPSYYVEPSPELSVSHTKALISYIRSLSSSCDSTFSPSLPLVQPILTPRFAISCSSPLLSSLGELASSDPSLHIQTHISENPAEISLVRQLFPTAKNYADVYDSFGLLRRNTVLGHAVHLDHAEVEMIKERGAGISHCPTSNFNLTSGIAPIGYYLDQGIKVFIYFLREAAQHSSDSLSRAGRPRHRRIRRVLTLNSQRNPRRKHRIQGPRDEHRNTSTWPGCHQRYIFQPEALRGDAALSRYPRRRRSM